jgi:hypothetical protein
MDVNFGQVITSPGQYYASITINGVTKEAPFIIEFGKPTVTNITASSFEVRAEVYDAVTAEVTIAVAGGGGSIPIPQGNSNKIFPQTLEAGATINFTFNGQPTPGANYYVYI